MKDKQKAYKEKPGAQLKAWDGPKTGAEKTLDEARLVHPSRCLSVQMARRSGPVADRHARILAEGIILQSIEDLWHPVSKKGSLRFFGSDGFVLCSELAGISYIKQLAMLRMLAEAGQRKSWRNMRKSPEGVFQKGAIQA